MRKCSLCQNAVLLTLLETTTLTNRVLSLGLKEFNTASRDGKVEMSHLAITYLTNLQTAVYSMLSTSLTITQSSSTAHSPVPL